MLVLRPAFFLLPLVLGSYLPVILLIPYSYVSDTSKTKGFFPVFYKKSAISVWTLHVCIDKVYTLGTLIYMDTKFIGVKDFRQNISEYAKKARNAQTRFVIVNRNKPLFELKPFAKDESLDSLFSDIVKAERDIELGKIYSHEEILKDLE